MTGERTQLQRALAPGPVDRARDEIARQIEADFPGRTVTHDIYGWAAAAEGRDTIRAQSAQGLRAQASAFVTENAGRPSL
ncbi:MAG: hypothetical protein ACRDNF_20100 [Streptosporangiaceae bacterium]